MKFDPFCQCRVSDIHTERSFDCEWVEESCSTCESREVFVVAIAILLRLAITSV